jgi:hypothetical protein
MKGLTDTNRTITELSERIQKLEATEGYLSYMPQRDIMMIAINITMNHQAPYSDEVIFQEVENFYNS